MMLSEGEIEELMNDHNDEDSIKSVKIKWRKKEKVSE